MKNDEKIINFFEQNPDNSAELTSEDDTLHDYDTVISYMYYLFDLDKAIPFVEWCITKFVESVLKRAELANKDYVIDWDQSDMDRIFLMINNQEYTIRTWKIYKSSKVEYTLFKTVDYLGNESHEQEVCHGEHYLINSKRFILRSIWKRN